MLNVYIPDCIRWEPHSLEELNYYIRDILKTEQSESVSDPEYANEDSAGRKNKFIQIFDNNWWMSKVSRSGEGSELTNTVRVEQVLDRVVERLKKDLGKDVIT